MAPQPIVIAVMGPSGSGKTNFINRLTRTREEEAAHQLKPHNQGIMEYIVNQSKDRQYIFVDTPGTADFHQSEKGILHMIAGWLDRKYHGGVYLSGIIYTHRITDNRPPRSVCESLDVITRLCGDKATCSVWFVTTMWDEVRNRELAECRVSQLENYFWKPLIDAGARHQRFEDNTSSCAWRIIRDFTEEKEALLFQEELVDGERNLNETTAGQALYTQFQKLRHEYVEVIKLLQEETKARRDPELVKGLEAEQQRLEAELKKMRDEVDKLRIPKFFGRTALLSSKNTGPNSATAVEFDSEDDSVTENDYVIFVVGSTEAGKTWFTRQLFRSHEKGRHPHAKDGVEVWRCNLGNGSDNIVIVNTPSFHLYCNNFDAENGITSWLESKFTEKCHSAILCLHSLDLDPASGIMSMSWHLEMFAKAFHNKFTVPSDIYVVPTCNPDSTLPSETLIQRLSQLKTTTERLNGYGERDWHTSMFPGVVKGQPETAWSAALLLLKSITQAQTKESFASPGPKVKCISPRSQDARLALKELADIMYKEFKKKERDRDLDAIITLGQIALEFIPAEHPQRCSALTDLACLLSERFDKERGKEDLDELIASKRAVLEHMSPDESQKQTAFLELNNYLSERFKRSYSTVDLEEIISLRRAALERTPPLNRCGALLNLADALHEQFQKQDMESSIAEAIRLAQAALNLCPPGHPDRALPRDRLASFIQRKFGNKATRAHVRGPETGGSSTSSDDIKRSIKKALSDKFEKIPLRLLHTPTGNLCHRDAQISNFVGSPQHERLLWLAPSLDNQQLEAEINNVISEYFEFAALSHTWEGVEPSLRDVEGRSIYDFSSMDGAAKLQMFCAVALQHDFQWAWSDTCCIDLHSSAELQEAIGSLFSWFRWSSLTIVYLSDVFDTGSLADSAWFTRGWTLQELLASHTMLFYTYDWSLYSKSNATNHKTDPALLQELRSVTGIAKQHLTNFHPGMDDARSRLHWASRRRTTRSEDIAYSLFGIFRVRLSILYGESAQDALGRLLAEIISHSGDISVLDWVGKPSSTPFHSCFPADLAPYQLVPHLQLIPSDPARRNSSLDLAKVHKLYSKLARLPRAGFVNGKLTLPSTVHQVTTVKLLGSSVRPLCYIYEIHASRLRPLNVVLTVELDESVDTYTLVRPWHPKSLEQQTGSVDAVWKLLEQLEQPFNALLLKRSLHNEYTRIACDCTITARIQDITSILDSEVLIPEIV